MQYYVINLINFSLIFFKNSLTIIKIDNNLNKKRLYMFIN